MNTPTSEKEDKDAEKNLKQRAFGKIADEFSEHTEGVGAALGRSTAVTVGAIEAAISSPKLLKVAWNEIKVRVQPKLREKLSSSDPEDIQTPPMMIAGPALEALRFTYEEEELCDLFTSLLATSMERSNASKAHPAFVSIIGQLTTDEARIVQYLGRSKITVHPVVDLKGKAKDGGYQWSLDNLSLLGRDAKVENVNHSTICLDNLCRLEIVRILGGVCLNCRRKLRRFGACRVYTRTYTLYR